MALASIQERYRSNSLSPLAYVFKTGWKDWRPIAECHDELQLTVNELPPPPPQEIKERRKNAPRATVAGKIIVHSREKLEIAKGVNISPSGIFVETDLKLFKTGESVEITCKLKNFDKHFRTKVTVIRVSEDKPKGYGMRFEHLEKKIAAEIARLIDQENSSSTAA